MTLSNGYEMTTTFWSDFTIADMFGINAIKDTYKRAFKEWKENYVYLTELVIVLNYKIWQFYEKGDTEYEAVYKDLWEETYEYAWTHLKDDELRFFYEITN